MAEILKTFCIHQQIGYHLYEITSSGLSHVGIWKLLFDYFFPHSYSFIPIFDNFNFAQINFNWGNNINEASFTATIFDIDGIYARNLTLNFKNDLYYNNSNINRYIDCESQLNTRINYFYLIYIVFIFSITFYLLFKLFYFLIKKISKLFKKNKIE